MVPLVAAGALVTTPAADGDTAGDRALAPAAVTIRQLQRRDTVHVFGPETVTLNGWSAFGAERFHLDLDPGATYALVIHNGRADGSHRVDRATVALNGIEIVGSGDLDRGVGHLVRPIDPADGDNLFTVSLDGAADAMVRLSVLAVGPPRIAAYGPVHVTRESGGSVTMEDEFVLPAGAEAPYRLHVTNGGHDHNNRASEVVVTLNGHRAFRDTDFGASHSAVHDVDLVETNAIAVTVDGEPGSVVTVRITAAGDATPPVLEITSPAADAVVGDESVAVSGIVTDATATTVTVNGIAGGVDEGGAFGASVPLASDGAHVITVVATDAMGNVTEAAVPVIADRESPHLSVLSPGDGARVAGLTALVQGTVRDRTDVTVVAGSAPAAVDGAGQFSGEVALEPGTNFVTVTATDAAGNTASTVLTLTGGDDAVEANAPDVGADVDVPLRINAGGANFTDGAGNLFLADKAFVAGDWGWTGSSLTNTFPGAVSGTTDDLLYQTMHGGNALSYVADGIADGEYEITFYFTEPLQNVAGQRVFDVLVEGVVVLDDFDIFAASGGMYIAHTEVVTATVSDGQLNIDFSAPTRFALISAIAVVSTTPPPPPPEEPDIGVAPASVDFGQVVVGETGNAVVTISNVGTQALTVSALSTSNAAFSLTSPATPFDVAAGGSEPVTVTFTPAADVVEAGDLSITSNDPDEALVTVPLTGEGVGQVTGAVFRLNSGGADFTDGNGNLFEADKIYTAGDYGATTALTGTFPGAVSGTTDDALYQSMRGGASFSYLFDGLSADDYEVTLYFTEPLQSAAGLRLFDVIAEGVVVLDDFDIFGASGGQYIAHTETFTTTVTDGQLTIDFAASTSIALLSAITVNGGSVAPPAGATYEDVAGQVGLVLAHDLGTICNPPIGSGSAWADYDGDGDADLFVTNRGGANRLYRNDGDLDADGLPDFTDVAAALGVDAPAAASLSSVFIDYDNDGDQDLYVTNWGGNTLWENQLVETGSVSYADVTAVAGLADFGRAITTAWGDFDQDGNLDVYLAKHRYCTDDEQSEDHLYHNNGDGTFTDRTEWLGPTGSYPQAGGLGFSPGWVDYDNDGDLDLYLVNDDIDEVLNYENVLWRNDGPNGLGGWSFTDVSAASNADVSLNGMGLGIGDYDNDGLFDFAFSAIGTAALLRNVDGAVFENVTASAGVARPVVPGTSDPAITWATAFFDHDNDGWLDLYMVAGEIGTDPVAQPNAFWINDRDGTFTDASAASGLDDPSRGRSASMVDFDDDGFVDIFVGNYGVAPKLYHNRSVEQGNTNNWLTVTVQGTISNRDGIGTRLTLTTPDGITQMREITSGPTHGGGDFRAAYFGLGDNATGDLVIRWPNGAIQDVGTVTANQKLSYIEP